jgi:hypothetical protein
VNLLRLAEKEEGQVYLSVAEESALESAAAWLAAEEERLGRVAVRVLLVWLGLWPATAQYSRIGQQTKIQGPQSAELLYLQDDGFQPATGQIRWTERRISLQPKLE